MTAPAPTQPPAPRSESPGSRPAGDGASPLDQPQPRRPRDFGIDTARLRRLRRIVFAILALPIAILALLALRFLSMPLTQAWSGAAYADGDHPTAIERLAPVEVLNWFEPYLPHLTKGTSLLQEGQDAAAEKELRAALDAWERGRDLNQPAHAQCKILNNLAISIERQADEIADPAARGDRLYEAEQLLAPCAGGGGGDGEGQGGGGAGNEDEETTGDNGERIVGKRKQADEEAGRDEREGDAPPEDGKPPVENPENDPKHADPSSSESPEEAPTPGGATGDPKQDELEERNKDANQGDGEDSEGGGQQDPQKPW